MPDDELPESWYRQVQGPDGHWYVIKAVRRGQNYRWTNDVWFEEFIWIVAAVGALVLHPFRRAKENRERAAGGFVVVVLHDGHVQLRVIRSQDVTDEHAVEAVVDEFEADVRSGKTAK